MCEPPPTASSGPKPRDTVPGSSDAAAGEGSTSPPFFDAVFHIPGVPPTYQCQNFHPSFCMEASLPQDNLERCFPNPWADKENQRLLLSHCWPDAAQSFKVWGTPAKRHSNVRGHRGRHHESAPDTGCSTEDGLIKSQQAHRSPANSRSGFIWKAKTKHIPFRSKTRLNPSLPFSFKIQVYRVVSGRSKAPCPPPPAQGQARSRQDINSARKLCFSSVDISPPLNLDSFLTLLLPSACKNLYKRE